MNNPYKFVSNIIYIHTINIGLSIILSATLSSVFYVRFNLIIFAIIIFFVSFLIECAANYKVCKFFLKKEIKRHKKFLCMTNVILDLDRFEKVDETTFLYVFKYKPFNSISLYFINKEYNKNDLKLLRKKCNKYINLKYPVTNNDTSSLPHWVIKGQIICGYNLNNSDYYTYLLENREKLYQVGHIRLLLDISENTIIVPFYNLENLDVYSLIMYKKLMQEMKNIFKYKEIIEFE